MRKTYDDFRYAQFVRASKEPRDTRNCTIWILLTFGLVAIVAVTLLTEGAPQ